MKLHYFDQERADADDTLLQLCIQQGHVPTGCLLAGAVVLEQVQRQGDPCKGCRGPRHRCFGRPFEAGPARLGERMNLGTAEKAKRAGRIRACFLGGDCAPSESHRSDDGALVAGVATPRNVPAGLTWDSPELRLSDNPADWWFDFVYARRLTWKERASARQWAAVVHQLHEDFAFEKILFDPGGGGLYVQRELKSPRQFINGVERDVTPIADQVDGPREVARGYFILHLFKRGDPGIELLWPKLAGDDLLNDAAYSEMKTALDHTGVGWPPRWEEMQADRPDEWRAWTPERREVLKTLNLCLEQFKNVAVVTTEDGQQYAMTGRGARKFEAVGKKDLMSAAMYCYLAFRIWLRVADWQSGIKAANRKLFSGRK